MLPASKPTLLTYSICDALLSPIFKIPFFVARNQPHHTIYHESDPIACSLVDFPVHWRPIYAFTVSICTTSKISAWRQGNTVTNCNNSRPGAIWIHDTGCYVLFLFFSDSREQRQTIGTWISKTGCSDLLFGVCRETTLCPMV